MLRNVILAGVFAVSAMPLTADVSEHVLELEIGTFDLVNFSGMDMDCEDAANYPAGWAQLADEKGSHVVAVTQAINHELGVGMSAMLADNADYEKMNSYEVYFHVRSEGLVCLVGTATRVDAEA